MKKITIAAAALLLSANTFAQSWSIDKAHSRIGFGIIHLGINEVDGSFTSFEGKISNAKPDFNGAEIEFSAETNSINTGVEARDKHLKSPDFFDAEKNPKVSFKSTSFKKEKGKTYKMTGNLTMHGVTKSVTLTATLVGTATNPMSKKEMAGFRITGKVNRAQFGIGPSMPAAMLSEDVTITANTEFSKD